MIEEGQQVLIPYTESEKSLDEQINDLGAIVLNMSLLMTHNMVQNNIDPTKEEIERLRNLNKQLTSLTKVNRLLKKSNKVGDINEQQFEDKMKDILNKKSSMPSIVQNLNKEEE